MLKVDLLAQLLTHEIKPCPNRALRSQQLVVRVGKEMGCLETTRNSGNDLTGVQWCWSVGFVPANLGHVDNFRNWYTSYGGWSFGNSCL